MSSAQGSRPDDMTPELSDIARYLEDTSEIDWQTPAVMQRALALIRDCASVRERIQTLFEWVRDEISHSLDIDTDAVPCRASEVLRERTGLCFAKSHLLVAMLRVAGVPAGFGYQRLRDESGRRGFVLHGFAGVYLAEEDRWIALDPRGNNAEVQTQFCAETGSLAYSPEPSAGECTYQTIYARPSRRVLDVLDRIDRLELAMKHLPDSL
jgi:transglutaminase-like putative cysteine protease